MKIEKIVSFLPSATELLFELGVSKKIAGVTHECLYPKQARTKPKVITSVFDSDSMTSKETDNKISKMYMEGKQNFRLNEQNLLDAKPDLIISQKICEVCAAHSIQVKHALKILDKKPLIYELDPHHINEVFETVKKISKIIGKEKRGEKLIRTLQNRIDVISKREIFPKPKIVGIEWIDPFFSAGHWVPEMVQLAGGQNLISSKGEKSKRIILEDIVTADPDIIILMPCGFDLERTQKEYKRTLSKNKKWNVLKAVKNKQIFAVDSNSFFSKPSIRIVTGIEILAKIFHPKSFSKIEVPENSSKKINS